MKVSDESAELWRRSYMILGIKILSSKLRTNCGSKWLIYNNGIMPRFFAKTVSAFCLLLNTP